MEFVNLHGHSTFSFGDGFGPPWLHAQRAAELGYSAMALTEHGNVSSHFQFEKAALKANIKPIFGLEAYTGATCPSLCTRCNGSGHYGDPRPLIDLEGNDLGTDDSCYICKGSGVRDKQQFKWHLTILAANAEGYRNLNRIVTQSYLDYYYHPTVSGASLMAHREGLIVLSGCAGSLLACSLLGGKGTPEHNSEPDFGAARRISQSFRRILGQAYYLEVQPFPELERTCAINPAYERLGHELGIRLVVTHDTHYPTMDDAEMQAVLHAVHRGKASVDDAMREWNYDVPMCLPESDRALADRLMRTGMSAGAVNEAIESSAWIASQCNVTLPKAERLIYPITEGDLRQWQSTKCQPNTGR